MEKLKLSPDLFARFSEMIEKKIGLNLPKDNAANWELKILPIADAFGFSNLTECVAWLTSTPLGREELNVLAKYLTIGETYFFRDANAFKALAEIILPELIRKRSQSRFLRIWSAACCTGEEPYSLAILLHQLIPDISEWNIHILGTDLNVEFLQKCEKGIYKEWSFRATPPNIRAKYFIKEKDGGEKVISSIRRMVKFEYLNLVEDKYPSLINGTNAMDIILCNNVLIYFSLEKINQVIDQLVKSLVPDGWLLSSAVEVPYIKEKTLVQHKFFDTTFFTRTEEPEVLTPSPISTFLKEIVKDDAPIRLLSTPKVMPELQQNDAEVDYKYFFDLYAAGNYREIIEHLEKKLNTSHSLFWQANKYSKIMLLLAKSHANTGQLDKALKWGEQAIAVEKLDAEGHLFIGIILQELERTDESIQALHKCLFLDPTLIIAYYVLGSLLIKKGRRQEAERNFRNALKLLSKEDPNQKLQGGDGMTAGRLCEIISTQQSIE